MKQGTLNLLRDMEYLGLIHMLSPTKKDNEKAIPEDNRSNRWLRGYCKNLPEGSVDEFLARCRADKEQEFSIEQRQQKEQDKYA